LSSYPAMAQARETTPCLKIELFQIMQPANKASPL